MATLTGVGFSEGRLPVSGAFAKLGFAFVILSLWGFATAESPTQTAAGELTYTNPTHKWSVSYPEGWQLDAKNPNVVMIKSPPGPHQGVIGILALPTAVRRGSLDDVADTVLRGWSQSARASGKTFQTVSRRRITLPNEVPAIEVVHLIGTGVVGRSRKVITGAFLIDAETHDSSWNALEPYFNQIVNSFRVLSLTGYAASGPGDLDLMSYAAAAFTDGYGKLHRARFTDTELIAFASSVPGTKKWKAATSSALPPAFQFPTVVWADFPTREWLLQLEVYGTPDNDGLARHVLGTLRATAGDPDCVWPIFRRAFGAGSGTSQADGLERSIRAKASAEGPQAIRLLVGGLTIIFNFNDSRVCYTYSIPGAWREGNIPQQSLSETGSGQLWLGFISPKDPR